MKRSHTESLLSSGVPAANSCYIDNVEPDAGELTASFDGAW